MQILTKKTKLLEQNEIDLLRKGIYLIQGDNGSGKTTLINQIINNFHNITFNTKEQECSFFYNKYNIISFCSQKEYANDEKIIDIIKRYNLNIDEKLLEKLLIKFDLNYLDLSLKDTILSGGELKKIYLINAILKNTPFLILDEPTNNLDINSIKELRDILKELKLNKTIIIISHDNYLLEIADVIYTIENKMIDCEIINQQEINLEKPLNIQFNKKEILKKNKKRSKKNIYNILVLMSIIFTLIFYLSMYNFSKLDIKEYSNIIEIFNYGEVTEEDYYSDNNYLYDIKGNLCDQTTRDSFKYYNVEVENCNNNNFLTLGDVKALNNSNFVNEIYYNNPQYYINENQEKISVPYEVANSNFFKYTSCNKENLVYGDLPRDYEKEIALTTGEINNMNDFIGNYSDLIGSMYTYKNEEYIITGVVYGEQNEGCLSYGTDNIKSPYHMYSEDNGNNYSNLVNHIFISYEGFPSKIFEDLNDFGGFQITTEEYENQRNIMINQKISIIILGFSLFLGFILSLLLFYTNKTRIYSDLNWRKSINNYYFEKINFNSNNFISLILNTLIVIILSSIIYILLKGTLGTIYIPIIISLEIIIILNLMFKIGEKNEN